MSHRAAWAIYYGEYPKNHIDHINGVRTDNKIINLRDVTRSENQRNMKTHKHNTSGHTGVGFHKKTEKWRANIWKNNKQIHLGLFDDFEGAVAARKSAEKKYNYHPNHGRI